MFSIGKPPLQAALLTCLSVGSAAVASAQTAPQMISVRSTHHDSAHGDTNQNSVTTSAQLTWADRNGWQPFGYLSFSQIDRSEPGQRTTTRAESFGAGVSYRTTPQISLFGVLGYSTAEATGTDAIYGAGTGMSLTLGGQIRGTITPALTLRATGAASYSRGDEDGSGGTDSTNVRRLRAELQAIARLSDRQSLTIGLLGTAANVALNTRGTERLSEATLTLRHMIDDRRAISLQLIEGIGGDARNRRISVQFDQLF